MTSTSDVATSESRGATTSPDRGRLYWLKRLRAGRPDLAREVEAGRLSAFGAAELVGWRKKRRGLEYVQRLAVQLRHEERVKLLKWLLIALKTPH